MHLQNLQILELAKSAWLHEISLLPSLTKFTGRFDADYDLNSLSALQGLCGSLTHVSFWIPRSEESPRPPQKRSQLDFPKLVSLKINSPRSWIKSTLGHMHFPNLTIAETWERSVVIDRYDAEPFASPNAPPLPHLRRLKMDMQSIRCMDYTWIPRSNWSTKSNSRRKLLAAFALSDPSSLTFS